MSWAFPSAGAVSNSQDVEEVPGPHDVLELNEMFRVCSEDVCVVA